MNSRGRCKNKDEFRKVVSALEEAKVLISFKSDTCTITYQNNSIALNIVKQFAPSGTTQVGMGYI